MQGSSTASTRSMLLIAGTVLVIGLFAIRCGTEEGEPPPEPLPACDALDGALCNFENVMGVCIEGACQQVRDNTLPCSPESLRSAVELGGREPFFFSCTGPVKFDLGEELAINNDVVLDGEGRLTLDGGGTHRVVRVERDVEAGLRGLTIMGGRPTNPFDEEAGGGVLNKGKLTLSASTISNNTARNGGGIFNAGMSSMTIVNSTIAQNSALQDGGGIYNHGDMTIVHSTISQNVASGAGDAIAALGRVTLRGTLIDGRCGPKDSPSIMSVGHNLESPDDTCLLEASTDQVGVSPERLQLGLLKDNGGGMLTYDLLAGSAAIGQIPRDACIETDGNPLETDQRGVERPSGNACDIGALEVEMPISYELEVFEFHYPLSNYPPVEGAIVCHLDTNDCVTSDASGIAVLSLPANREIAFTVDKEGYGSWLFANVTDENFPEGTTAPMAKHELLASIADDLQTPYPWEQGMVALQRWPPIDGATFVPVGPTADAVGDAFYLDVSTERYSLDLEATMYGLGWAEAPLAQGGFTEVTHGVHQFELSGTAGDCSWVAWAWPGDAPNQIRVPVRKGYTSYGSMRCD